MQNVTIFTLIELIKTFVFEKGCEKTIVNSNILSDMYYIYYSEHWILFINRSSS